MYIFHICVSQNNPAYAVLMGMLVAEGCLYVLSFAVVFAEVVVTAAAAVDGAAVYPVK